MIVTRVLLELAGYAALLIEGNVGPEHAFSLQPWTDFWYKYVSRIFIKSYLDTVRDALFMVNDEKEPDVTPTPIWRKRRFMSLNMN